MSIKNSNSLDRLRSILVEFFKQGSITPRELMHNIEILSNRYTGDLRNSKVKDLALSYALYFMPEHLPKPLFILTELRDRFLKLTNNIQIIYDLGCGTGTGAIAYKIVFNDNIPVILTDINIEMLNLASRILSKM